MNKVFTKKFVNKFKKILIKLYGYEEYMDFLIVPSIMGKKTIHYLPLLNYTDRINIDDLLELAKNTHYQIRILNFKYEAFKENDPVVMRINIENKTTEEVFENVKSRCRNKIRNSIKRNNFILKKGNDDKFIDDFYYIFSKSMLKHGTPVFDKKLFILLRDEFKENNYYYIVYNNNKPIAAMCMLFDKDIVWYPWGGIDDDYSKDLVGYFIYWKVIEDIVNMDKYKIIDLGRSGYKMGTYYFKSQFGAYPVKIDILKDKVEDIYSKYDLAVKVWQKLPLNIANFIGPRLCKYLEDL